MALLFLAGKRCRTRETAPPAASEAKVPAPPQAEASKGFWHWFTVPIRKADREKHRREQAHAGASPPQEKRADAKKADETSSLTDIAIKALGAVATGVGVTGAVVVVGAAVFWARFDAIGVPPIQAVTAIPRTELLVQGAQEMIIFVLIALGATLLIGLADPKATITRGTVAVLLALVGGGVAYAIWTTLSWEWVLALAGLASILAGLAVGIGFATGQRIMALLVTVFLATFLFSASCAFLIARTQHYAQAIAILSGADRTGLTGIYVTTTDKTIYFANVDAEVPGHGGGLYEVPRTDATTYAIGPLERIENHNSLPLQKRAEALLDHMRENEERLAAPRAAEKAVKAGK